jgi:gliding motility-associated-like protein
MFSKKLLSILITMLALHTSMAGNGELEFIENKGQWPENIEYNGRLNFGNIYLENNQLTFRLIDIPDQHKHEEQHQQEMIGHQYSLSFVNANPNVHFTYSGKSAHSYNFFLGNNQSTWKQGVKSYGSVSYRNLYDGINMGVFGDGENIKYEYYIAPNHDPSQIKVKYNGLNEIELINGELVYQTEVCLVKELAPYAYQKINGETKEVACHYQLNSSTKEVSYKFPHGYDSNYELVIDPSIVFARLSGSTSDNFGFTATYDANGRAYSGGIVFGVSGQYQTTPGAFSQSFFGGVANPFGSGLIDIGISCYDDNTGNLVYGTYIGGSNNELPNSMVVNNKGELIVLATTGSDDFPIGLNAYDNSFAGGQLVNLQNNGIFFNNGSDIVLFKLNANGSAITGGTYIGGSDNDGLNDDEVIQLTYDGTDLHFNYGDAFRGEVIVDEDDNVYVASSSNSPNFPTLGAPSSLQGNQDAVVFKLDSNLTTLMFSRFLGGANDDAGYSMKIDNNNNLFVDGGTKSPNFPTLGIPLNPNYRGGECDGYIAKINSTNGNLIASTFIGTNAYDQVYFVDLDENNDVYILGQTLGNYPVENAAFSTLSGKQFIHKLDNNLSTTIYSTIFGTGGALVDISPTALLVDNCERVYVSGWGGNTNQNRNVSLSSANIAGLPITADAFQNSTSGGGDFYFFVLEKNATGQLFGSYFGGTAAEHVDGGTSRFDERGIVYQAICAACGAGSFPSSGGFSSSSSSPNCNEGLVKLDIGLAITNVEVNASPTAIGCAPLSVNFQSILEDVTAFEWYFGDGDSSSLPNPTHTYTDTGVFIVKLIGTDINSCNEVDSAFLTVTVRNDTLIASTIDTLYTDCDSLAIFVGAEFVPTSTYDWTMGDGTSYLDGGNAIPHTYGASGEYTIILHVTDTSKCETEAWDTISLSFAPQIDAEIGTSSGCVNTLLPFENFSNPDAETFIWDFGNGQTSNEFEPTISYANGGDFTVILTVIDSATCIHISTDTGIVSIIPPPNANFRTDSSYYLYPDLVNFTNLSVNFDSYEWTFGDGESDSTNIDPIHFYQSAAEFTPCLKVSNAGCMDSICLDLFIDFIPLIGVPNAFSPNGDNTNDIIYVEGVGIINLSFQIYNRWGELVFESFDQSIGWEGTYKGVLQEMEVYTYVVKARFLDNSSQTLKGNITLLR